MHWPKATFLFQPPLPGYSPSLWRSRQELQTASHVTPTLTSPHVTPMLTHLLVLSSLTQFQTLYLGNGASYSGLSHPTSINLIDTVFYRLTHCRQSSIKTHFPGNARLCSANKPKNTFLLRSEVLRLESLHLHSIWNTSFAQ